VRRATLARKAIDKSVIELHRIAFARRKTARALVVVDLVSRSRGSTDDEKRRSGIAWSMAAPGRRIAGQ
jgi:hypothetical protein